MKHIEEMYRKKCNCGSSVSCSCKYHNQLLWRIAIDECTNEFRDAIRSKLIEKHKEGKSGWDDPNWSREDILRQLREHVDKGDMVDVAAFAMFAWNQEA